MLNSSPNVSHNLCNDIPSYSFLMNKSLCSYVPVTVSSFKYVQNSVIEKFKGGFYAPLNS